MRNSGSELLFKLLESVVEIARSPDLGEQAARRSAARAARMARQGLEGAPDSATRLPKSRRHRKKTAAL